MGFWDLFTTTEEKSFSSNLHRQLSAEFPEASENELTKWACIAGLMARVANRDLKITQEEEDHMESSLVHWIGVDQKTAKAIKNIAIRDLNELAGLENHKYCEPLTEILSKDERYSLLVTLFDLAASDGNADNEESEEIRIIARGLLLERREFTAARATVLEYLGAAKKDI